MAKLLKCIIILIILFPTQLLAIGGGGIGIGAEVPDTGYNNISVPSQTFVQPQPAENKYINDFVSQLLTEENAKRPIDQTKQDVIASYVAAFMFEIGIIVIFWLIFVLIYHCYRKFKKAVKASQKSVDKSLSKNMKK